MSGNHLFLGGSMLCRRGGDNTSLTRGVLVLACVAESWWYGERETRGPCASVTLLQPGGTLLLHSFFFQGSWEEGNRRADCLSEHCLSVGAAQASFMQGIPTGTAPLV